MTMKNEEEKYIEIIDKLLTGFKEKLTFNSINIEYNNIELQLKESNLKDINPSDFSISFQKQNGSFTVITKNTITEEKRNKIQKLVQEISGVDIFASYSFSDMTDITITHYVYDKNKEQLNHNILTQTKTAGKIVSLNWNKHSNH